MTEQPSIDQEWAEKNIEVRQGAELAFIDAFKGDEEASPFMEQNRLIFSFMEQTLETLEAMQQELEALGSHHPIPMPDLGTEGKERIKTAAAQGRALREKLVAIKAHKDAGRRGDIRNVKWEPKDNGTHEP